MNIFVCGSLAYDKIMTYSGRFSDHILPDKAHTLGISFVTDDMSEHFGGTAGNISYNLALLGEKPQLVSAAGKDFGPYRDWLSSVGVDLSLVRIIPEKSTAFVTIMTDKSDNQISALYLGTMAESSGFDGASLSQDSLVIISPGNITDMRRLPDLCRQKNTPFIFDPGQQIDALSPEDIQNGITGAKALIVNDYELSLVLAKTGWTQEDILAKAQMLVVTLGEKGSRIYSAGQVIEIPSAKPEKVADPTGAGDAYRAGLIKALAFGWPLEVAGRFAGVVAAYAIEAKGPQGHSFTLSEARERYSKSFGEGLPA